MNSNKYILTLFLLISTLTVACTENITGPDATIPDAIAGSSAERLADLSLDLEVDPYPYQVNDSSFVKVTAYVYNEGPDQTAGVHAIFTSDTFCRVAPIGDENETNVSANADFMIWDIVQGNEVVGVYREWKQEEGVWENKKTVGGMLVLECLITEVESIELNLELLQSYADDPDSTPGNGKREEDDQVQVRLYPEVPPCPDCPVLVG